MPIAMEAFLTDDLRLIGTIVKASDRVSGWRDLNVQRSLAFFFFIAFAIFKIRSIVKFLNTVVTKEEE